MLSENPGGKVTSTEQRNEKRRAMRELGKAWERNSTLGNPDSQSEQAQKNANKAETQKGEKKESTEQRREKEAKPYTKTSNPYSCLTILSSI
ncbi:hypothetical protein BD770DRAFT_193977, partial [Pilaira anomala]